MVDVGAVVTEDVPPQALVVENVPRAEIIDNPGGAGGGRRIRGAAVGCWGGTTGEFACFAPMTEYALFAVRLVSRATEAPTAGEVLKGGEVLEGER